MSESNGYGRAACPRLGKLFGGCRFEARYDAKQQHGDMDWFWTVVTVTGPDVAKIAAGPRYLGDICTRCGEWRARQGEGK